MCSNVPSGLGPHGTTNRLRLSLRHGDDDRDVVADLVPRHGEMDALRRPDRVGVGVLVERADLVGPDTRRADDDRARIVNSSAAGVDHGAVDPPVGVAGERRRPGCGWRRPRRGRPRCGRRRASGGRRRWMRRSRGRPTRAARAASSAGARTRRRPLSRRCSLPIRQPPVRSYIHIAEPRARAILREMTPSLVRIGIMNGRTSDEMGGVLEQSLTFVQRLVDEPDVAVLEVPQTAVDELGALRRGPAGEVVALDERGAQATCHGVERDAGAGDPAADDQHVELLVAQSLEHRGAVERGSGHRADARCWAPAEHATNCVPRLCVRCRPVADDHHLRPEARRLPRRSRRARRDDAGVRRVRRVPAVRDAVLLVPVAVRDARQAAGDGSDAAGSRRPSRTVSPTSASSAGCAAPTARTCPACTSWRSTSRG